MEVEIQYLASFDTQRQKLYILSHLSDFVTCSTSLHLGSDSFFISGSEHIENGNSVCELICEHNFSYHRIFLF